MAPILHKKVTRTQNQKTQNSALETIYEEFNAGYGMWRTILYTEVEWLDKTNKIYNEDFVRKAWLFGILIYNKHYKANHHGVENAGKGVGFGS